MKKNTVAKFAIQHRAMGTHTGLFSNGDTGTDVCERADVGCSGQPSGGVHESRGMHGEGTGRGGCDTVEMEGHGEMMFGGPGYVFDGPRKNRDHVPKICSRVFEKGNKNCDKTTNTKQCQCTV